MNTSATVAQANTGIINQIQEGIQTTCTKKNVAAAAGSYTDGVVRTYAPGLMTSATVALVSGAVGPILGIGVAVPLAPIVIPAATGLLAYYGSKGAIWSVNKIADALADPNSKPENPTPAPVKPVPAAVLIASAKVAADKKAAAPAANAQKKEAPLSLARQYGKAVGETYGPTILAEVVIATSQIAAMSLGLPAGVGTVVGGALIAPFVVPAVTPTIADATGVLFEQGVKAATA